MLPSAPGSYLPCYPMKHQGWLIFAMTALLPAIAGGAEPAGVAEASSVDLPDFVVTATRGAVTESGLTVAVDRFTEEELAPAGAMTIDEALGASAAFGLFRRSGSLTAHPTAQGMSLRNIGPSGASRSLALLDGVPLNDPFGGWVAWSKIPRLSLRGAEIVRGGGSGVWGSSALGGVVQLLSREPEPGASIMAEIGDYSTQRAEVMATARLADAGHLRVGGRWFETDGFFQYKPGDRGDVDRRLDSRHTLAYGDYAIALRNDWRLSAGGRYFDEKRGNGTPFQRNSSEERSGQITLSGAVLPDLNLKLAGYVQSQTFASGFSSVELDRAAETPALDQFDVPANAAGLSAVLDWTHGGGGQTVFGADVRYVRGETREAYVFNAGAFQRERYAGGKQTAAGAFVLHRWPLLRRLDAQAAMRADRWRDSGGHRRESVIETGAVTRDDRFAARDGWQLNPSVGLVWRATESTSVRASVYRAFRLPTLNERYRPFRVGNVATDANPALSLERLVGAESAVTWTRDSWTLSAGVFEVRLEDAVANVTLSSSDTLIQRQRRNLERTRVRGLELQAAWKPAERIRLALDFLLSDARVVEASLAPATEGRRLPQSPREVVTAHLSWRFADAVRLELAARATAAQYEDDANQMRLPSAVVGDFTLVWRAYAACEVYLAIDNVTDESVAAGVGADERFSFATPRLARAGASWSF